MGIVGFHGGNANDLWQIRKYETKQISGFSKGEQPAPYKTAVIVRELLYATRFILYLSFPESADYETIAAAMKAPAWALSLGREDELVRIEEIKDTELDEQEGLQFVHTVLPYDVNSIGYKPVLNGFTSSNLLQEAPRVVSLPVSFQQKKESEVRIANQYRLFSFIGSLPVMVANEKGFKDTEMNAAFQLF